MTQLCVVLPGTIDMLINGFTYTSDGVKSRLRRVKLLCKTDISMVWTKLFDLGNVPEYKKTHGDCKVCRYRPSNDDDGDNN